MAKREKEPDREHRLVMDIVVDAHDDEERGMSWYYYLQDKLQFPFTARCVAKRAILPLKVTDEVEVIDMPDMDECGREMFVVIRWEQGGLAVPLMQVEAINADDETCEAIEDWRYWVEMGYQF